MDKDFKLVKSVYESNYDAIKNIMHLHNIEQFDLDCTYSKGSFWKNLPSPKHKSDLYPSNESVIQSSSENLPFEDQSMRTVMYDPPFIIVGKGMGYKNNKEGSSIMAKRFEGYGTFEELKSNYYYTLKELYRVTEKGGMVVMKCQDTVSGGKQHLTHVMVINMALELGFYPKDFFILTSNVRINAFNGTKWTKQFHARKYHSYFMVFEKIKPKVSYMHPDYIKKEDFVVIPNIDLHDHQP